MTKEEIKPTIKKFLLEEFLQGASEDDLDDDTPLMTGGILDSISTTRLVAFLEKEFDVQFAPHEMGADYLDKLDDIAALVVSKKGS